MKTSKIVRISSIKPWTGDKGTVLYHHLEMENGDKIEIGKKKELQIGWEISYEITGDVGQQEYVKAKAVQPQEKPFVGGGGFSKGGSNSDAILYQVCLKGAMDYYNSQDGLLFTPENINDLAYAIALRAKENINKLQS